MPVQRRGDRGGGHPVDGHLAGLQDHRQLGGPGILIGLPEAHDDRRRHRPLLRTVVERAEEGELPAGRVPGQAADRPEAGAAEERGQRERLQAVLGVPRLLAEEDELRRPVREHGRERPGGIDAGRFEPGRRLDPGRPVAPEGEAGPEDLLAPGRRTPGERMDDRSRAPLPEQERLLHRALVVPGEDPFDPRRVETGAVGGGGDPSLRLGGRLDQDLDLHRGRSGLRARTGGGAPGRSRSSGSRSIPRRSG